MATTAQEVFDIAMGLMDEVNEATGATDTTDTREYKQRTVLILTALRGELYPFSDSYKKEPDGSRPVCPIIGGMNSFVPLDDVLCQSVMPYGLAAHLLLNENPDAASFFQQRYEELIRKIGNNAPASFEAITDVYGGIEFTEFSRW
ncbi:MAG: hypothetical protein RSA62_07245 [Oscillospiraceae bacterium]